MFPIHLKTQKHLKLGLHSCFPQISGEPAQRRRVVSLLLTAVLFTGDKLGTFLDRTLVNITLT